MSIAPAVLRVVAGYRVLRTLARGDRAEILLGHGMVPSDDDDVASPVALKVLPPGTPVGVEAEALDRAAGPHVVRLLDVSLGADEACLVMERLPGEALADLLARRTRMEAGEAVTIVAPIADTVNRMHAAGVAHGHVSVGSVLFRDDGAPVLVGFGSATLFAPATPEVVLETIDGVRTDREGMRTLALAVLERVAGSRAASMSARIAAASAEDLPSLLAEGLFEVATALPVRFDDEASSRAETLRAVGVAPAAPAEPSIRSAWLIGLLPDEWIARVTVARERLGSWSPRRRRVVLAAVAAAIAVPVIAGTLPTGSTSAPIVAEAALPSGSPSIADTDVPEDPLEALAVLLERRESCLRDLSVLCLEGVAQAGSAALDLDRATLAAVGDGGELPRAADGDPVLVERLGDSALVQLPPGSWTDSVLLMRGPDGWRIRDYLDAVEL